MKFKCPSRLLLCKKLLFQKIKHPLWLNTFKGRYFTSHRHNHCINWKINIWSIFSGSKVAKLHGTIKYNIFNIQNVSHIIFISLKLIINEYSELCMCDPMSVKRVLLDSRDFVWDCRPNILSRYGIRTMLAALNVGNNPDFHMIGR